MKPLRVDGPSRGLARMNKREPYLIVPGSSYSVPYCKTSPPLISSPVLAVEPEVIMPRQITLSPPYWSGSAHYCQNFVICYRHMRKPIFNCLLSKNVCICGRQRYVCSFF